MFVDMTRVTCHFNEWAIGIKRQLLRSVRHDLIGASERDQGVTYRVGRSNSVSNIQVTTFENQKESIYGGEGIDTKSAN